MSKKNMKKKKWKKVFGAWLAIVIVLVAILAVLVYKNANRKVYITQYDDKSGSQGMFYTITVSDGSLIVVDSGNPDNEEYVRQVLEEKGNHVNAWILTHPHPDHIGAFNQIWQQLGDIQVDAVYTINMNYDNYKALAQEWDNFETFDLFTQITQNDDKNRRSGF